MHTTYIYRKFLCHCFHFIRNFQYALGLASYTIIIVRAPQRMEKKKICYLWFLRCNKSSPISLSLFQEFGYTNCLSFHIRIVFLVYERKCDGDKMRIWRRRISKIFFKKKKIKKLCPFTSSKVYFSDRVYVTCSWLSG